MCTFDELPDTCDVREEAGIRIFTLPPCNADDRISSITYMPIPEYQGDKQAQQLFHQSCVSKTVNFVNNNYRERKAHCGDEMIPATSCSI
jgi:hypothetical protein